MPQGDRQIRIERFSSPVTTKLAPARSASQMRRKQSGRQSCRLIEDDYRAGAKRRLAMVDPSDRRSNGVGFVDVRFAGRMRRPDLTSPYRPPESRTSRIVLVDRGGEPPTAVHCCVPCQPAQPDRRTSGRWRMLSGSAHAQDGSVESRDDADPAEAVKYPQFVSARPGQLSCPGDPSRRSGRRGEGDKACINALDRCHRRQACCSAGEAVPVGGDGRYSLWRY